jgi:hypothetical protein
MEFVTPDWGLLFFILIVIGGAVAFAVFFLLNLANVLKQCSPQTRKMPPGQVWLYLIPIFGIIWIFIMVARIADSVAAEYHNRQMPCPEKRPGYAIGLTMAILGVGSFVRNVGKYGHINFLYLFGLLLTFAYLVVLIIYWVKMAGYKNELRRSGHWPQFAHMNTYSQTQQTGSGVPQQNQQPNTPPPSSPPPPTDQNDYSRWIPPGS